MEVDEVTSSDLGPGRVLVASNGEIQYELTQSANSFITNSQIVSQSNVSDPDGAVLSLPIQFVQLHDPGGDSPVPRAAGLSGGASSFSGGIIIKNNPDGTRTYVLEPSELAIGEDDSEGGRLIPLQDMSDVTVSNSLADIQERGEFFQLDENMVTMNEVGEELGQTGVILANTEDYISQKEDAIPQFAALSVVDGQMVLTTTEGPVDNTITLEGGNLVNSALAERNAANLTPSLPLALKEKDVDPPINKGPYTCTVCNLTIQKWPQYKKHIKKHQEDKPYRCHECDRSFNVQKNLRLHEALHSIDDLVCPECNKLFRRLASFKNHLSLHEEDESVTCEICLEEFISVIQLEAHQVLHKEGYTVDEVTKAPLKCKECDQEFGDQNLLFHHMKAHKKVRRMTATRSKRKSANKANFDNRCNECGKTFFRPSQLIRHIRIHTGERPFKCLWPGCDRAFNQKNTMQIHMDIHTGTKSHKCEFCNQEFIQRSNLRCHIKRVHPVGKVDQLLYECDECPCKFKRAGSLNAHISRAHTGNYNYILGLSKQHEELDNSKGEQEKSNEGKDKVSPTSPPKEPKDQINKVSSSSDSIQGNSNGAEPSTDGDILQQALKNIGLPQSKDQQQNIKKEVKTDSEESGKENLISEKAIEDLLAAKKAQYPDVRVMTLIDSSVNEIKRYSVLVRTSGNIKWHICNAPNCDKEFKKPSDLVRHIRSHTSDKPFKCTKCFRAFSLKTTLTAHMKTHHVDRIHKCEGCNKAFLSATSLRVHSWMHSGIKPYNCPHCPRSFRTPSHRKAHILTHMNSPHRQHQMKKIIPLPDIPLQEPILITSDGPVRQISRYSQIYPNESGEMPAGRPYKCHYCLASFKKSSHLKQHERTHTGERPFKCNECNKHFISHSVLKMHYKTHTGQRSYVCVKCNNTFATSGSLKRHLTTHTLDKPYMCPYCQKTFKTNTNCKKHMKTHKQELAMDAIRAAGASLEGDNEQALLTASLYSQQGVTASLTDADIDPDLANMTNVFQEGDFPLEPLSTETRQQQQHPAQQEDMASAEVLPSSFTQGSGASGLTLTDLQTGVQASLGPDGDVILSAQSSSIASHLRGSSILISQTAGGSQNSTGSSILIPNSSSNGASILHADGTSLLSHRSGHNPTSSNATKHLSQVTSGTSILTIPRSSSGTILSIHQPSVIQGPSREESANVTSVIQAQPSILDQSEMARFGSIGSRQVMLNAGQEFSNSLEEAGGEEIFTIPTSMISTFRNSQNTYSIHDIQSNINQERSGEVLSSSSPQITEVRASETGTRSIKREKSDSFTNNLLDSEEEGRAILSQSTSVPESNESGSASLIQANLEQQGFPESFTLHVTSGLELGLSNSADIPFVQLLSNNTQESVQEGNTESKVSSILSSECNQYCDSDPLDVSVSKVFECTDCKKTFQKQSHLRMHRRIHAQEKTSSGGISSGKRSSHHTSKVKAQGHSKPPPSASSIFSSLQCKDCPEKFNTISQFFKHVQFSHSSSVKCPICEEVLENAFVFEKHLNSHVGDAVTKFKQSNDSSVKVKGKTTPTTEGMDAVCVVQQTSEENLNPEASQNFIPPKSVTREEERLPVTFVKHNDIEEACTIKVDSHKHPHQCQICSKSFKKPSDLVRHIRTHTGEKPFSCAQCGKSFAVKSTLDVHLKTHSGKKDSMCPICNTMFATKGSLNIHMRLHTGDKPFKCNYCDMSFRTSGHRKTHVLKHLKTSQGIASRQKLSGVVNEESLDSVATAEEAVVEMNSEENLNSVVMMTDGSALQLPPGFSFTNIDSNVLLNIHPVTLDETMLNQLEEPEVTMITGEGAVDEDAEDSISVNPNVVMTQSRAVRGNANCDIGESGLELQMIDNEGKVITNQSLIEQHFNRNQGELEDTASFISQELCLSDLVITGPNNTLTCTLCSKQFLKVTDWAEHMTDHSIYVKVSEEPENNESELPVPLITPGTSVKEEIESNNSGLISANTNVKLSSGLSAGELIVIKSENVQQANQSFKSATSGSGRSYRLQNSIDQQIPTTVSGNQVQFSCSHCYDRTFPSVSALQKHMKLNHKCVFCAQEWPGKESLQEHIISSHLHLVAEHPEAIEKLGLKINVVSQPQRELDPLELFPLADNASCLK